MGDAEGVDGDGIEAKHAAFFACGAAVQVEAGESAETCSEVVGGMLFRECLELSSKQATASSKIAGAMGVAEEAIVSNADKGVGEYVK